MVAITALSGCAHRFQAEVTPTRYPITFLSSTEPYKTYLNNDSVKYNTKVLNQYFAVHIGGPENYRIALAKTNTVGAFQFTTIPIPRRTYYLDQAFIRTCYT